MPDERKQVDETNAVVQHWRAQQALDFAEVNPIIEMDVRFPEVSEADVVSLDRALAHGCEPGAASPGATQELACLNYQFARELVLNETVVKRCARTLLGLCVDEEGVNGLWLAAVIDALSLFGPGELDHLFHYQTAVAVGNALTLGSAGLDDAVAHYEQAVSLAEGWTHLPSSFRKTAMAAAMGAAGGTLSQKGDHASGIARIRQALELLPVSGNDSGYLHSTRASLLDDLGRALETSGDLSAALRSMEEAVAEHRTLDPAEVGRDVWLGNTFRSLGDLLAKMGRHEEALDALEDARECLQGHAAAEEDSGRGLRLWQSLTTARLCEVLRETGRTKEAEEILERVLADHGVQAAALVGHEKAATVIRLSDQRWMASPDGNLGPVPSPGEEHPPSYRRLLAILNADRDMVQRMIADCESVARNEDRLSGRNPLTLSIIRESDDRAVRFYQCVALLQRLADMVCAGEIAKTSKTELRFEGFTMGELDVLARTVTEGESRRDRFIAAGAPGEDEGWLNYDDPHSDYYYPLPDDAPVALCAVEWEPPNEEPGNQSRWIWEAFGLIVEAARSDEPRLRKCSMPCGLDTHLDYLLGERPDDAPSCGTFYIAWRRAETCGRERCKKAARKLRDDYEIGRAKRERAETLARRAWAKADMRGSFEQLWEESGRDLLHLTQLLKGRRRKTGRKR